MKTKLSPYRPTVKSSFLTGSELFLPALQPAMHFSEVFNDAEVFIIHYFCTAIWNTCLLVAFHSHWSSLHVLIKSKVLSWVHIAHVYRTLVGNTAQWRKRRERGSCIPSRGNYGNRKIWICVKFLDRFICWKMCICMHLSSMYTCH